MAGIARCRVCKVLLNKERLGRSTTLCPPCRSATKPCDCGCGKVIGKYNRDGVIRALVWPTHSLAHRTAMAERRRGDWSQSGYRSARTGRNHPAWKGGRSRYVKDWKRIRRAILKRDGYKCRKCGTGSTGPRSLHVHHRNLDETDNRWRNLVTLCASCHAERHRYLERLSRLAIQC